MDICEYTPFSNNPNIAFFRQRRYRHCSWPHPLYSSSASVPWQERKDEAARRASCEEERQKPWTTKHGRARNCFAAIVAQNPRTHQTCSRNIM